MTLLMRPIPPILMHLRWEDSNPGPFAWGHGYYALPDGRNVLWPRVVTRKWHPRYWWLRWRLRCAGHVKIGYRDPFTKAEYEVYEGELPAFQTTDEMMAYLREVNAPYEQGSA